MNIQNLLGTDFDNEVAKIAGVSRTRIWQLRKKAGIPAYCPPADSPHPRTIKNEKKLKIFLERNSDKEISLQLIRQNLGISQYKGKSLNLQTLLDFAKSYNIEISLKRRPSSDFTHGRRAYSKKICDCRICRLSNNINTHFRLKNMPLKAKHTDELANKYIEKYVKNTTFKRIKFWKFLEKKVESLYKLKKPRKK